MKSLIALILVLITVTSSFGNIVTGVVRDSETSEPVPFVTVTVLSTGLSTTSNDEGGYHLSLQPGNHLVKFSHIAHHSDTVNIRVGAGPVQRDVSLRPALIEVAEIRVYEKRYDAAQRIIVEAIARKDAILSRLKKYSFDAYTKLVARDTSKADSAEIRLIVETQLTAFWKYPDKYKEIITARQQTANMTADQNLLSVGEILNFNKNRIDMGRYAVVSPTATDALDHYDYYLLDTVYVDNQAIFVLEIEPKNPIDPLFEGIIKILDSSYAIVGVDITLGKGFDIPYLKNPRYVQVYSQLSDTLWMPSLIQFQLSLDLPPIPPLHLDYQASLHDYDFDLDLPDNRFDEYALEVDSEADDVDSAAWSAGQTMPLTRLELHGYYRIDSVENNLSFFKKARRLFGETLGFLIFKSQDFAHFNRVEGFYLGAGHTFEKITDRLDLRAKTGYAIDGELWQHRFGLNFLLAPRQKSAIDIEYHDEVRTRPTVFARPNGNATLMAMLNKTDAYDYYREKGVAVKLGTKVFDHTRLTVGFSRSEQLTVANSTEYSMLRDTKKHRLNPPIVDGDLRSIEASFSYDNRLMIRDKGRDRKLPTFPRTLLNIGVEHTSNELLGSDFDFTRYYLSLRRKQRTFGWIVSSYLIYAGASDRDLPPQKYFMVDFDAGLIVSPLFFHTLGGNNFAGSRALALYTYHDFGRKLFQKSGIPLINKVPLTLQVYGGAFWSDFKSNPYHPADEFIRIAPTPYSEIGFSIGTVIPLGLGVGFTWQLSAYDTDKFVVSLCVTPF